MDLKTTHTLGNGIGGGIYLVPLIIILGLGTEKEAAACGAIFVWVNSVSALAARLHMGEAAIERFAPILIAAVGGGAIGSFLAFSRYSPNTMQKILGGIIVVAIVLLLKRVFFG